MLETFGLCVRYIVFEGDRTLLLYVYIFIDKVYALEWGSTNLILRI